MLEDLIKTLPEDAEPLQGIENSEEIVGATFLEPEDRPAEISDAQGGRLAGIGNSGLHSVRAR